MTISIASVTRSERTAALVEHGRTGAVSTSTISAEAIAALEALQHEVRRLRQQLGSRAMRAFLGHSPAAAEIRTQIAECDDAATVLIQGEPGAGAETVAQAIHTCGRQAHRAFVKLDAALLSAEALERELNPAPRAAGALGGEADDCPPSRLEAAAGGTLYLKNVDLLAPGLQRHVLALVRRQCGAGAAAESKRLDRICLVASTHADLQSLVEQKRFRDDLYAELSTRTITVPPLRDRVQDIGLLAEHFIGSATVAEGKPTKRLTVDALKLLEQHGWPGNAAELRHVVEQACALEAGPLLTAEMIRPWIAGGSDGAPAPAAGLSLREMERKLIETTFARCEGNRERTAQALQIGLRTLSGKLREYGYPPRGGPGSNLKSARRKAA